MIETAGNYPWKWLAELLSYISLVMYDLKLLDPELHDRYIGNRGELIRANLRRMAMCGFPEAELTA